MRAVSFRRGPRASMLRDGLLEITPAGMASPDPLPEGLSLRRRVFIEIDGYSLPATLMF